MSFVRKFCSGWAQGIQARDSYDFSVDPLGSTASVSAEVSEFSRAELEAFVNWSRYSRPAAWAHVDVLRLSCGAHT